MLLETLSPMNSSRDNAEIIKDCGEHMLALINNILDIERIETKRLQLECLPFKPASELDALLKVFQPQVNRQQVLLRKEVRITHATRMGDPLRWKQILFNLVSNAIKFTSQGGSVTVRLSDDNEEVRVEVEDTGIGIAEEHLSQLFRVPPSFLSSKVLTSLTSLSISLGVQPSGHLHHKTIRWLRAWPRYQPAIMPNNGRPDPLRIRLGTWIQVLVHGDPAHPLG